MYNKRYDKKTMQLPCRTLECTDIGLLSWKRLRIKYFFGAPETLSHALNLNKRIYIFLFYPECIKVDSRLISCMPDQMIHPVLMLVQDSFTFETITVTPEHKIQGTHFSNKNCEDNDVRKFKSSICGSYKNVRLAHLAVRQSSSLHHTHYTTSLFFFIFSKSVRRDFNTTTDRDKSVFSLLLQSSADGLGHSCLLSKCPIY